MSLIRLASMSEKTYSLVNDVTNALLFQLAWISLVLNFYGGLLGLLFVLLMLFHRLMLTNTLKREMILILVVCLLGVFSDAAMFSLGVYQPVDDRAFYLVPIWLVGLWFGFSMTMYGSLNWLIEKPIYFTIVTTIAGPLSYLIGSELSAIKIASEQYPVMFIQWFLISILMVVMYQYLQKKVD